jgi:ABC-type lipoprotein release transport system permease subunit
VQIPWFIALNFLRQYRAQAWLTMTAVSVGVAVMVFLSALITGLQQSLIKQTLGTQPHITLSPVDEAPSPQRKETLFGKAGATSDPAHPHHFRMAASSCSGGR